MQKSFYNIIVNDYAGDSHMSARIFSDKTFSVHIKKGERNAYVGSDSSLIKAFINRAGKKLYQSRAKNFKIAFDYRNHRLHFKINKGGAIFMSTSRQILDENGNKKIVYDSPEEVFAPQNYGIESFDMLSKFRAMRECADGFMQIIDHKAKALV